jgi:hypothetical protein
VRETTTAGGRSFWPLFLRGGEEVVHTDEAGGVEGLHTSEAGGH